MQKFKRAKKMARGVLITGKEMKDFERSFRFYSLVYPILWLFAQLDRLLILNSGYMIIARAKSNKLLNTHNASYNTYTTSLRASH
jgi:hypothetical protein